MLCKLVSIVNQWNNWTLLQGFSEWCLIQGAAKTAFALMENNPISLCLVTSAFFLFLLCSWKLRKPYELIKDLSDVGFEHLPFGRKNRAALVREEIRNRNDFEEDLLPVFPNGWIPVIESRNLPSGTVKPLRVWGQDLVAFRSESGSVFVVDAFCPHLGAHLGVGGRVYGDCIECPFHGWRFRGSDGACVHVPYSDKVPEFTKLAKRVSYEVNGLVFVWFHAEGEPPYWEVPNIQEIQDGTWTYRGFTQHTVNCYIQEITENGADVNHLKQLHSASMLEGNGLRTKKEPIWKYLLSFLKHIWSPTWTTTDQKHLVNITFLQEMSFCGIPIPFTSVTLDIMQVGPALVLIRASTWFGRLIVVESITPEGPMRQKLVYTLYAESRFPRFLGGAFLWSEAIQLERDIIMWNNKRLLRRPTLVPEDKLIIQFRRWYSQFYSEHSPTLQSIRRQTLDW